MRTEGLSINLATVRQQWNLVEAVEACARRGITCLDPWRDQISAVGLDTASIDHGPSTLFATHVALFRRGVPAFENVANLDRLPNTGFTVVALPMKIAGGSGGPLRIVAILDE